MKYWKVLTAAAMLLGLTACGGGGGDDKNDPPPAKPGDAGSVVFSAKAPAFINVEVPATQDAAGKSTVEKLAVEFTLTDAQGNPITLGSSPAEVISLAVTQLMPARSGTKHTFWKAFTYKNAGTSDARGDFEKTDKKSGTLEDLGNGNYRYIFKTDFKHTPEPYAADDANGDGFVDWDDTKTHRLTVTFGQEGTILSPVNYTLDWVPAGGEPTLTRNMLEQESCSSCHMDQPIHHTDASKGPINRADPKICVACHNESVPTSGRRTLAALVHDFHSKASTAQTYPKNGAPDKGTADKPKEETGAHYPQDPRNCDTCHKPVTSTTQDADNWFKKAPERACEGCHFGAEGQAADTAPSPATLSYHGASVDSRYTSKNGDCSGCHNETATSGKELRNVHMGRLSALNAAADTLKIDILDARYDESAKQITVELNIQKDNVGINDITTELLPYVYKFNAAGTSVEDGNPNPGLLVNWDDGEGMVRGSSSTLIKLKDCIGSGGHFTCTATLDAKEPVPATDAVLTVAVSDLALCGDRKAVETGGVAALKVCKGRSFAFGQDGVAPTVPVAHFNISGGKTSEYVAPVGADQAKCESCHEGFKIHFGGSAYDHAARDFNQCASCHNSERASATTADLKSRVHRLHAVTGPHNAGHIYPGAVNNCESCHTKDQYNIPNQKNARASKVLVGTDTKYFSPTLVVCASCHLASDLAKVNPDSPAPGDDWASHMKDNGAVFGATTAEEITGSEQCASCHDIGGEQGVDKVHKVFDFR